MNVGFWGGIGSGRTAGSYNGYYPRYNRYYPRYNGYYSRYSPRYLGKRSVEELGKVEEQPKVPTNDDNEDDTLDEDNFAVLQNYAISGEQRNVKLESLESAEDQEIHSKDQPSPRNGRTFWKKSYSNYNPSYTRHYHKYHDSYYPRHFWKRSAEQIKDLTNIPKKGTGLELEHDLVVEDDLAVSQDHAVSGEQKNLNLETMKYVECQETSATTQPNPRNGRTFWKKSYSKYSPTYSRHYHRYHDSYYPRHFWKRSAEKINGNDGHVDRPRKDLSDIQKMGTGLEHENDLVVDDSLDEHVKELGNMGKKEVFPRPTEQDEDETEVENAAQNPRTGRGFFWKSRSKYYPSYNRYYPRYQGSYDSHYHVKRSVGQENENGEKSKGSIITE